MNLRSGRQLGPSSDSDAASRVPTLGSGTRSVGNLETIREDISSDTDSESWSFHGSEMSGKGKDTRPSQSQQSSDMHAQGGLRPPTNSNPFLDANIELDYNVALKYFTMNVNNAYIYKDPWGRFVVKLADTETPFEVSPWVNYQHDSYMGKHGDRYLITKEPYSVDNLGSTIHNNRANQGTDQAGTSKQGTVREGKEQPDANDLFKDLMNDSKFSFGLKQDSNPENEKKKGKLKKEVITVDATLHDWSDREIYQDASHNFYMTPKHPMDRLPEKHVIVEETWGRSEPEYKDNLGNKYVKMSWEEIMNITYLGVPLFAEYSPRATAIPDETAYSGETITQKPKLYNEQRIDGNRDRVQGSTGATWGTSPSQPKVAGKTDTQRGQPLNTGDRRVGASQTTREPPRPPPRMMEDPFNQRRGGHGRRHDDEYSQKVRPSTLQKLVKKYNGSGDPYDHIASFRQVVHAEQVTDTHTKIEGFGLTLEGKALSWFQTLDPSMKETQESLEEDFVAAFLKMGIKHNVVAKIHSFEQAAHESVRDCANPMKQYIARCPQIEKPSQKQIGVDLFGRIDRQKFACTCVCKETFNL